MTARASGQTKAPISSHPAFPAIVALWFAALLGLGSLVLPVVLLESIAAGSGLAAVLPGAQPPLGITARILIALAASVAGVAAGLWIARKVVAAQAVEHPRKRNFTAPDADAGSRSPAAKRPISAREELGIDKLDSEEIGGRAIPGRRRPLSVTQESGRSDYFEHAPLPGQDPPAPPVLDADLPEDEALDLGGFAEDCTELPSAELESIGGEPAFERSDAHSDIDETEADSAQERQVFVHAAEAEAPAREEASMDDPSPSYSFANPANDEAAAPRPFDASSAEPESVRFEAPAAAALASGSAAIGDIAARPLGELGMVELVERFALSLQRRAGSEEAEETLELPPFKAPQPVVASAAAFERAAASEPELAPALADEPPISAADEEVADEDCEDDALNAALVAAVPAEPSAPAVPAALRPVGFEDDDEEGDDISLPGLSLPLDAAERPFARPQPCAASNALDNTDEDEGEADDEGDDEADGYSSLLAMKSPLGAHREFVRIEDNGESDDAIEPVVVFPGQQHPRRAAPASDGPSRDPLTHPATLKTVPRPFDGPAGGQAATHPNFASPATPTHPAEQRADPGETERALRAALEKLQKMSGTA